jgi:predicted AlkP superfamily phosphohydrolase/phosphomutase
MKPRVLVIGLDGATPQLVFKWAKEGKLPNLSKLIENGASGNLRSTIPPMTAAAWTSSVTGNNPGKHGIYHFIEYQHKTYDYRIISSRDVKSKTIWKILNEQGKSVGIMQVPITYPPEKVNGFMVTDGLTTPGPESSFTYPKELKNELLADFDFMIASTEKYYEGNEENYIKDLVSIEEKKSQATIKLMKRYDWDFFMVVYSHIDAMQHFFWKYMDETHPGYDAEKAKKYGDAILNIYQKLDSIVGDMLEVVDEDTTVIIMSDHGFGPLYKELHLNKWLKDLGLLNVKRKEDTSWLSKSGVTREMAYLFLVKLGLNKITKMIPENLKKGMPSHYTPTSVDWSRTKAYSLATHGMMYINLKGRNPEGIVEPGEEYEKLRDFIIQELYALKDPETGKKIVDKVFKSEELYFGGGANNAPDIFVLTDMTYHNIGRLDDYLIKPAWKLDASDLSGKFSLMNKQRSLGSGNHRMDGIFIMKGKTVKKNSIVENAQIIDIAPTVLHLMGVPVAEDMDGKVLKEILF